MFVSRGTCFVGWSPRGMHGQYGVISGRREMPSQVADSCLLGQVHGEKGQAGSR